MHTNFDSLLEYINNNNDLIENAITFFLYKIIQDNEIIIEMSLIFHFFYNIIHQYEVNEILRIILEDISKEFNLIKDKPKYGEINFNIFKNKKISTLNNIYLV